MELVQTLWTALTQNSFFLSAFGMFVSRVLLLLVHSALPSHLQGLSTSFQYKLLCRWAYWAFSKVCTTTCFLVALQADGDLGIKLSSAVGCWMLWSSYLILTSYVLYFVFIYSVKPNICLLFFVSEKISNVVAFPTHSLLLSFPIRVSSLCSPKQF